MVGTLVWDSIIPVGAYEATEEWGGIAYSLTALDAALDPSWSVLPMIKVGRDVEEQARSFLGTLERVDTRALVPVDEPNNRVELRYQDEHERIETLSGGVPGWSAQELLGAAASCDALYVNFISGFELEQKQAVELRSTFPHPIYADLHSLFLGIDNRGERFPRCPDGAQAWMDLFDVVQMNRHEATLATEGGVVLDALGAAALVITGGPDGVTYELAPTLAASPVQWPPSHSPTLRTQRGRVPANDQATVVDPTGCGDVWGAACFAGLLSGLSFVRSAEQASRMAETALGVRGTAGLAAALASRAAIREGAS